MKLSLRLAGSLLLLGIGACSAPAPQGPYANSQPVDRSPDRAERLNQQAVAVLNDDPARAELLLREALTADLFNGPAHNNLGTILLQRGEFYRASEEFEWARRLLPGHPDPRMNLALTLELAGRTDDAISTYRTALEVYPEHIPSLQALTRLQVRTSRTDAETPGRLATISLRGETAQWRDWARLELARRAP